LQFFIGDKGTLIRQKQKKAIAISPHGVSDMAFLFTYQKEISPLYLLYAVSYPYYTFLKIFVGFAVFCCTFLQIAYNLRFVYAFFINYL
jgi:hypothetical protein